jgi:hypothetical protein
VPENELGFSGEQVPIARRGVFRAQPHEILNAFQPLSRMSQPAHNVSDMRIAKNKAGVELQGALE